LNSNVVSSSTKSFEALKLVLKWARTAIFSLGRGGSKSASASLSDYNQDKDFIENQIGEKQQMILDFIVDDVLLFVVSSSSSENSADDKSSTQQFSNLLLAFVLKEFLCPNANQIKDLVRGSSSSKTVSVSSSMNNNSTNLASQQLRTCVEMTLNSLCGGNTKDRIGKLMLALLGKDQQMMKSTKQQINSGGFVPSPRSTNNNNLFSPTTTPSSSIVSGEDEVMNFIRNVCSCLMPHFSANIVRELRGRGF
jgi:hypothetical protein